MQRREEEQEEKKEMLLQRENQECERKVVGAFLIARGAPEQCLMMTHGKTN